MPTSLTRVETALAALKEGRMVLVTDDPDREDEGDLIMVAEKITPQAMNFMIRQGTGIVCLALTADKLKSMRLPLMVPPHANTCARGTQFTVSIDAKSETTTGVSASDRATTILTAIHEQSSVEDFVVPGHVFPLQAKDGGVFERQGHTEGAVDLARLAGFSPAAVLCEVMNPDGSMARGNELIAFANTHNIPLLSIDDIMTYRLCHENTIASTATTHLPLQDYGDFSFTVIKEKWNNIEHILLEKPSKNSQKPILVRVHSSCVTGDLFGSQRCDCHQQLHYSLDRLQEEGGILIYLNQEGRGIGLFDKIRAYALQEQGCDTVEANERLGLPVDSRRYYMAANILRNKGISAIRLMTNNPHKVSDMKKFGMGMIQVEAMPLFMQQHNQYYLETKQEKLNHSKSA